MEFRVEFCEIENEVWQKVRTAWREQCDSFDWDIDLDDYARASMTMLDELAEAPSPRAKVCVLLDRSDTPHAAFQVNSTRLPGFDGYVLRVRHLVLAPLYDNTLNDETKNAIDGYKSVLASCFAQVCEIARTAMPSQHVKLHFRTAADLYFFGQMRPSLAKEVALFTNVKMYGAWLSLSLV